MELLRKPELRLLLSVLFLAAFLLVTLGVVSSGYIANFDTALDVLIAPQTDSLSFAFFVGLTYLASTTSIAILFAILLLFFIYKKKYNWVFLFVLALGGGAVLQFLVKNIVHRARPIGSLVSVSGYSFPSGHALKAVLFFSLLIYLFLRNFKSDFYKHIFVFFCVALTLLIGFSRIYLHAHWISDVLGGWLLGISWFFFCVFVYERLWK